MDREAWQATVHGKAKNLPATQETQVGKIPWRREWLPTPVFWPGESHGQGSLAGYSPWGCKELDMTKRLSLSKVENGYFQGNEMTAFSTIKNVSYLHAFLG